MATAVIEPTTYAQQLEDRIRDRTARVGVLGLGYVGLPLAVQFAEAGFTVTGIDVGESKVACVNDGDSYVLDVPKAVLEPLARRRRLRATTDFAAIAELDTVNICVPTPLRKTKDPDMSYIDAACREIAKHMHPGMLITLESTTYPGTTDEFVLPMLRNPG
jgi:UDP-N-acetyl-D-glucosamine dehydrogenase